MCYLQPFFDRSASSCGAIVIRLPACDCSKCVAVGVGVLLVLLV